MNVDQIREQAKSEAIITVSHSETIKLVPGEEFFGKLRAGSSIFMFFAVDPPSDKNTQIEFSQCLGDTSYGMITAE